MTDNDLDKLFERVRKLAEAAGLPGLEVGTSYGTPALKVAGKSFCRMKDRTTLVLMMPLDQKEFLMEAAPEIYFETPHYSGWPAVLVRLGVIDDTELGARLVEGWRFKAPKRLGASFLAS
jgi:hypothetical protein